MEDLDKIIDLAEIVGSSSLGAVGENGLPEGDKGKEGGGAGGEGRTIFLGEVGHVHSGFGKGPGFALAGGSGASFAALLGREVGGGVDSG